MKVAFLHPDLGLGGAERLVVDAAAGLAERGNAVSLFTSYYNPARSFSETRAGLFAVVVHGDWLPRSLFGGFFIAGALARNAWLALSAALSADADVFVCDQVSICVPILRLLRPSAGIVFYCHYPDQLLSPRSSLAKALYRAPFDALEEAATALADAVLVNSKFTQAAFARTFRTMRTVPAVLYPCVMLPTVARLAAARPPQASPVLLVSINRFERKKGIALAVRAFALLLKGLPGGMMGKAAEGLHLVLAGGYDDRVRENIEHYEELVAEAKEGGLLDDAGTLETSDAVIASVLHAWPGGGGTRVTVGRHVTFVRSFTDEQKEALLDGATAVVYTPENEHFGIVPLECMAARRPVLACTSGGPLESVLDGRTGFLCAPTPDAFAQAMGAVTRDGAAAARMGAAGARHVADGFSRPVFAQKLEAACAATVGERRPPRTLAASARHWSILLALLLALILLPALAVADMTTVAVRIVLALLSPP
jgi:alpha-1,3/alpha-1,6-mannosyltransferase